MNNGNSKREEEVKMKSVLNKGLETAKEVIEEQTERLKDKVSEINWTEVPGEVKSYVRRQPWKSLAIAVGLGFLAGYILKPSHKK